MSDKPVSSTGCAGNTDCRFGAWVSLLNRAASIHFGKALRPFKLGPGEQAYLLVIGPGEEISQNEMADRLRIDKGNVARAVKSLCAEGYLDRRHPPADRRQWLVRLTEEGGRVRSIVEEMMSRWVEGLRRDIPEDQWSGFVAIMGKVATTSMDIALREPGALAGAAPLHPTEYSTPGTPYCTDRQLHHKGTEPPKTGFGFP